MITGLGRPPTNVPALASQGMPRTCAKAERRTRSPNQSSVKIADFRRRRPGMVDRADQESEQQKPEPAEEEAEVVAGRGENGVDGVALAVPEIVAAHAVLGFEMTDDGLDGGSPAHLALDLGRHAPASEQIESGRSRPRTSCEPRSVTLILAGNASIRARSSADMRIGASSVLRSISRRPVLFTAPRNRRPYAGRCRFQRLPRGRHGARFKIVAPCRIRSATTAPPSDSRPCRGDFIFPC